MLPRTEIWKEIVINFLKKLIKRTEEIKLNKFSNIEEIEDIKVAVAEACTNAIKHGLNQDFNVCFDIFEEKITVSIKDNGKGYNTDALNEPDLEDPKEEGGLGIFIIKSLMDEVTLKSSVGQGTEIKMIKFLGDGN